MEVRKYWIFVLNLTWHCSKAMCNSGSCTNCAAVRAEEMRWKCFGVCPLANEIEFLNHGRWWHVDDTWLCSSECTQSTSLPFPLTGGNAWSAMQQWVCQQHYRDWISITKCQSVALIQNYLMHEASFTWTYISWSQIDHSRQIGGDVTQYYFHAVPLHGHLCFQTPHCPETHHRYLVLSIKFNKHTDGGR